MKQAPDGSGFDGPQFHADIDVKGRLTLTLTPLAQFGINWQIDVPDVSVSQLLCSLIDLLLNDLLTFSFTCKD